MNTKMKSPAKQTIGGKWPNNTTDPQVLANRKAADLQLKSNVTRKAKEAKDMAAKKTAMAAEKYNKAKSAVSSKDKSADVMVGSWTPRQRATSTVKELEQGGYKAPVAKAKAKAKAKAVVTKPVQKAAATKPSYATANKGGAMDKLVKARNMASKGSAEYAKAQNAINAALGSKVKHSGTSSARKKMEAIPTKSAGVVSSKMDIKANTPMKMKKAC